MTYSVHSALDLTTTSEFEASTSLVAMAHTGLSELWSQMQRCQAYTSLPPAPPAVVRWSEQLHPPHLPHGCSTAVLSCSETLRKNCAAVWKLLSAGSPCIHSSFPFKHGNCFTCTTVRKTASWSLVLSSYRTAFSLKIKIFWYIIHKWSLNRDLSRS